MSKCLVRLPPSFSMGVTTAPNVSKPQNGSGETLTITCCNCGMPSSIEWAQRIHTRPQPAGVPFYPFLVDSKSPQAGVHIITQEDGTTYLCAFCHASLEAQWNSFEKRNVPTNERYYKTNNFICAVCGVQTYRKRVRALPFKVNISEQVSLLYWHLHLSIAKNEFISGFSIFDKGAPSRESYTEEPPTGCSLSGLFRNPLGPKR